MYEDTDREDCIYRDGKKAGIKEVVDWIHENSYYWSEEDISLNMGDLHEKLKEWDV